MKNCPNCGAPIKRGQHICVYCETEIEREPLRENDSSPIAPYGGKIGSIIRIRHDVVKTLNDEELSEFCKNEFYKIFEDEIKKHIIIKFRENSSFADPDYPIEAKGEIELYPIDELRVEFENTVYSNPFDIETAQPLTRYRY